MWCIKKNFDYGSYVSNGGTKEITLQFKPTVFMAHNTNGGCLIYNWDEYGSDYFIRNYSTR